MSKLYAEVLKKGIFPIADSFMKTDVIHYLKLIEKMNTWSKDEIISWQNNKLKDLVNYAYNNTAYYKELFDENGISVNEISCQEDLIKVPILRRSDVIKYYDKIISKSISKIPHKKSSTGGTTGVPMKFLLDNKSWSYANANYIFNWERVGYNFGDKHIALGSTSISVNKPKSFSHKVFYRLKNKIGLNGMVMSDSICENYIKKIKKEKIKYIYGYASSIYLLAKYSIENDKKLEIDCCFSTSEVLTDFYRDSIEKAFGCKVVNCYGAHDSGITAFEHIKNNFEVGYNTIINSNNDSKKPGYHPIITTNLLNFSMPMINYELGDNVLIASESNDYNGQTIEKILGRTTDIIEFENGVILTTIGFYTSLFKKMPVAGYKMVKNSPNELGCMIVKKNGYDEVNEKIILDELGKYVGNNIRIEIKYVDNIESSKSGKKNHTIF